jgi:hypothetical protein
LGDCGRDFWSVDVKSPDRADAAAGQRRQRPDQDQHAGEERQHRHDGQWHSECHQACQSHDNEVDSTIMPALRVANKAMVSSPGVASS